MVRLTNSSWHTLDINGIQLEKGCLYQYDGVSFIKLEKDANNTECDKLHQLWPITDGLIKKTENRYEAINLNGECVGPFEDYRTFGNEVIGCKFNRGYSFYGEIAVVELSENTYCIIDKDGNFLFNGQSFFKATNLGCGICALQKEQDDDSINVVNALTGEILFVVNHCEFLDNFLYELKKDDNDLTAILDVRTQEISAFKYDELWQKQKGIPFVVGFLPFDSSGDCSAEIINSDGKVIGTSKYSILRNDIQLFLPSGIIVTKNLSDRKKFKQDTLSLSNWKTGESDSNIYDSYTISKNGKYIILSGEECFKCITVDNKEIGSSVDGYIVDLHVNTLWVASEYVISNPEATKNEMLISLQDSAHSAKKNAESKCRRLVRSSVGHAHPEPFDIL